MVKVTNTRPGGIGLPGGQVIPAMGSAEVSESDWSAAKTHPAIEGRIKRGDLLVGDRAAEVIDEGEPAEIVELRQRFEVSYRAIEAKAAGLEKDVADRDARIAGLEAKLAGGGSGDGKASSYAVKEKSAGWFVVVTKDGAEATKSLRKGDLEGFDTMSGEDKAAFVELHKAEG